MPDLGLKRLGARIENIDERGIAVWDTLIFTLI